MTKDKPTAAVEPKADAQAVPVAWLHKVKQHGDDEEDQALSFSPDNFPFQTDKAPGFYSLGCTPLYATPQQTAKAARALEQKNALRIVDAVREIGTEEAVGLSFRFGWKRACDEIDTRLCKGGAE